MSIQRIDDYVCIGCGACMENCPLDVIRFDEQTKKAFIAYPQDCMVCFYCEKGCPVGAITVTPEMKVNSIVAWG